MSIVGERRYITEHSLMLVHQLSSMMSGKMAEIDDDFFDSVRLQFQILGMTEQDIFGG